MEGGKGETGERVVKKGEVLKVLWNSLYILCAFTPSISPASEMLGVKIKKKSQYLQSCLTHTVYAIMHTYQQIYTIVLKLTS